MRYNTQDCNCIHILCIAQARGYGDVKELNVTLPSRRFGDENRQIVTEILPREQPAISCCDSVDSDAGRGMGLGKSIPEGRSVREGCSGLGTQTLEGLWGSCVWAQG